jgi:cation:H+ antiporter
VVIAHNAQTRIVSPNLIHFWAGATNRMHDPSWAWLNIVGGLIVLTVGGELLVRGAVRLAAALRIPSLVIGLTVVAFGTSAPELAVSVQAAVAGSSSLALGNVVGSNVFNVLFILGISALIMPLVVSRQLTRWDVPVMIASSALVAVFSWDRVLGRIDGLALFAGLLTYVWWCIRQSHRPIGEVKTKFALESASNGTVVETKSANGMLVIAGLTMLTVGSRWLIFGAVQIADSLGVSQLVIGLTIVAAGTSLPEVATSVIAALRKERDIAVGNVVGSNIFNILCVLGISSVVAPAGIPVDESALQFDMPLMIAVAVVCLPIFLTGHIISRWEGALFVGCYVMYSTYRILVATGSELTTSMEAITLFFVVPLIAVTLAVALWRARP